MITQILQQNSVLVVPTQTAAHTGRELFSSSCFQTDLIVTLVWPEQVIVKCSVEEVFDLTAEVMLNLVPDPK